MSTMKKVTMSIWTFSLLLVGSCAAEIESPMVRSKAVERQISGGNNSKDLEHSALEELVRVIAMSLSDDTVRLRVGLDMARSRAKEHKLEFAAYIGGDQGQSLLRAMLRAGGIAPDSMITIVRNIRPLEFYIPVRSHRHRWTGDGHVLVAASIDDQSVTAFGTDGTLVPVSMSGPPEVVTFALVPVETDFSKVSDLAQSKSGILTKKANVHPIALDDPECDPETAIIPCDDGGDEGGLGPYPPGVYLDSLDVRDTHEPWIRGDPEIDMLLVGTLGGAYLPTVYNQSLNQWLFAYDSNAVREIYSDCAGGNADGYRWFDPNGTGKYVPFLHSILFGETQNFAVTEEAYDVSHSLNAHQRLSRLGPPFHAVLLERDDGTQCPDPPKSYDLEASFQFRYNPFSLRLQRFGWQDIVTLFGGNNDVIASFFFSSYSQLEGLNHSFYSDLDADVWLTNIGFHHDSIPAGQDPWNGQ